MTTKIVQAVTRTVKALPVAQERAQMSPERVAEQRRTTGIAVLAWATGGAILHFLPALPWYVGAAFIAYGLAAFDQRLFGDFFKYLTQFLAALRSGKSEAP